MTQLDHSPDVTLASAHSLDLTVQPASMRSYAVRDTLAVASGMVAFGLMLGVTISTLRSDPIAGLAGTFLVYGGSAQLTAVTLLHQGIALPAAVLTILVATASFIGTLVPRLRSRP